MAMNGMQPLKICSSAVRAAGDALEVNAAIAIGGLRNAVCRLSATSTPKNTGSMPKSSSSSRKIGTKMMMISVLEQPAEQEDDRLGQHQEGGRRQVEAEHELLDQPLAAQVEE